MKNVLSMYKYFTLLKNNKKRLPNSIWTISLANLFSLLSYKAKNQNCWGTRELKLFYKLKGSNIKLCLMPQSINYNAFSVQSGFTEGRILVE